MKKSVLVIGGSYFLGRTFSIHASERNILELHVVNRGRYPLNRDVIKEYKCDRHDISRLMQILPNNVAFDAVVDFCGYEPGEIHSLMSALHDRIAQYIFISTCALYDSGDGLMKSEDSPLCASRSYDNPASSYITKKIILESELVKVCAEYGVPYTILRPSFIYGPFNYAPRESFFIEKIVRHERVPILTDSTSQFSFVYAKDVARALECIVSDRRAYNEIFNLSAPECVTYTSLMDLLKQINGSPFEVLPMTVSQAELGGVQFPFPLEENALFNGEKIYREFGFSYTTLFEGMSNTFDVLRRIVEKS